MGLLVLHAEAEVDRPTLGAASLNSSMVIWPTGSPPMLRLRKTSGLSGLRRVAFPDMVIARVRVRVCFVGVCCRMRSGTGW